MKQGSEECPIESRRNNWTKCLFVEGVRKASDVRHRREVELHGQHAGVAGYEADGRGGMHALKWTYTQNELYGTLGETSWNFSKNKGLDLLAVKK